MAANPSMDFLEELGRRRHLELFEQIKGTLRLDLTEGQETVSWLLVVDDGDVGVSSSRQDADCVVHAERTYFDRVVTGQANALAGLLRGVIEIEGNLQLALVLGRALPGPTQSRWRGHRRSRSGGGR